jgi:REP element-mobilizing transposase RayT
MGMTLFRDKYRIESARKPHWDYTLPSWYFVTICTLGRKSHFGQVANATVNLSPVGEYVDTCWKEIPQHHQHIDIDDFVVMPNHMHAIAIIGGPERLPELREREKFKRVAELNTVRPKANSLGAVVGSFKSAVTRWCVTQQMEFDWQPRFHDRIIRGKNSLKAVREYIRENPANWCKDKFYVA